MKKMITLLMLMLSATVFAKQNITLSPIRFQVNTNDALSKLEQTILNPEGLLMRFQPVGAQISDKNVSEKMVNFIATKKLLFVSKSVYVNGVLESSADNQVCPPDDVGYILKMHFDSSDPLVINNVKGLEAILCLHSKSDSSIEGIVQSKIIIGSNYSKTFGPITINLIKEQIAPLLSALTEEVKSLR